MTDSRERASAPSNSGETAGMGARSLGRTELARELREWEKSLPLVASEMPQRLREHLPDIVALLEDDSVERDARRYQAIKRLKRFKDPDKYFLVIDDCLGLHSCHKNNVECFKHAGFWRESLDAALDAWLEGEGK